MYLRKRKSNLSIERAVYEPAQKDSLGNVIKPAVRSTLYLGSIPSFTSFNNVPKELLQQLTEAERLELRDALKANEPKPLGTLGRIPATLEIATLEIRNFVKEHGPAEAKRLLDLKMKAADAAWAAFFKAAQDHGLKRKGRASKKPKAPLAPTTA